MYRYYQRWQIQMNKKYEFTHIDNSPLLYHYSIIRCCRIGFYLLPLLEDEDALHGRRRHICGEQIQDLRRKGHSSWAQTRLGLIMHCAVSQLFTGGHQ